MLGFKHGGPLCAAVLTRLRHSYVDVPPIANPGLAYPTQEVCQVPDRLPEQQAARRPMPAKNEAPALKLKCFIEATARKR